MTDVDHRPARLSALLAAALAAVSAASLLAALSPGAAFGLLGLPLVAVGAFDGRRATLTLGAGLLALGALATAAFAGVALPPLLGAAAAVVARDVGENGIGLGEQVGRDADTTDAELAHATASVLVGVVTVALGYGVFRASTGGKPLATLVLLLFAVVILTAVLRS